MNLHFGCWKMMNCLLLILIENVNSTQTNSELCHYGIFQRLAYIQVDSEWNISWIGAGIKTKPCTRHLRVFTNRGRCCHDCNFLLGVLPHPLKWLSEGVNMTYSIGIEVFVTVTVLNTVKCELLYRYWSQWGYSFAASSLFVGHLNKSANILL